MGKKFNKTLAWLLTLAMLILTVPVNMRALEGENVNVNETETELPAETEAAADTEISTEVQNDSETESSETAEETEDKNPKEQESSEEKELFETESSEHEQEKEETSLKEITPSADDAVTKTEDATETEVPGDTEETENTEETEKKDETQEAVKKNTVYTLYITHTLLYKKNGKGLHMQESDTVKLTQSDFKNGGYNLLRNAYIHEALTAELAPGCPKTLFADDFWEGGNGGMEFHAEIRYRLKEGWKVRFSNDSGYSGSSFRGVYEGIFNRVEFVPGEHITVTINYKYSNTGGLAGIEAHAPDIMDLLLKDDGTADITDWEVPHYNAANPNYHGHSHNNLEGFRIVLNPEPLNQFVVNPNGTLENGDFNLREDVDTSSPEYQQAWDAARSSTVTGKSGKAVTFSYTAPAENGGTLASTSSDPAKMYKLNASGLTEDISLTVYYRRDAGTYKVNHWKAKAGIEDPDQKNELHWDLLESRTCQGRAGMITDARRLEDSRVIGYNAELFSQQTIQPDGSTEVNIYYVPKTIRVIFDSDDIYIARQQVPVDGYIKLDDSVIEMSKLNQAKPGYEFDCWQYRPEGGEESSRQDLFSPDAEETDRFQLTQEFLDRVWIEGSMDSEGVQVIRLYPKWRPAMASVRVVFWTENLNGQDVEVTRSTYDFNRKQEIFGAAEGKIVHQEPGHSASFSNAGSFEIKNMFRSGDALVNADGSMVKKLDDEVRNHLDILGKVTVSGSRTEDVSVSEFYETDELDEIQILVEKVEEDGTVSETESETAASNRSTLVYVYLTRKVYTLEFNYYFKFPNDKTNGAQEDDVQISQETSWFYNSNNWTAFENGTDYPDTNYFTNVSAEEIKSKKVPMTVRISGKYGADLREVWPAGEDSRYVLSTRSIGDKMRVSWSTTSGLHNSLSPGGNVNVPGAYSTMSPAIVANAGDSTKVHHLVAFWAQTGGNNAYRYNYCYEIPDLMPAEIRTCESIKIYNDMSASDEADIHNTIYMVPADHEVFLKYGFTDLLRVSDIDLRGTDSSGRKIEDAENYYAVRIYGNTCYALSRQLIAFSALSVSNQNPSARPYLTLVNGSDQDHSTEITSGGSANFGYDTLDNPYDIYFYYARDIFTLTYMSDAATEIGQLELPYGTNLFKSKYAYELDDKKTNGDYADRPGGWSLDIKRAGEDSVQTIGGNIPVCPERSPESTKDWVFEGWSLGPSGTRKMEWGDDAGNRTVTLEGNLLLYAVWKSPQYKVTFDWDGGVFVNQPDKELLAEQWIPGNRPFVSNGEIPRPIRSAFILSGWVVTARGDAAGNKEDAVLEDGSYPQFLFEEPVNQDLWVRAVWTPVQEVEISYTVYYLAEGTDIPVRQAETLSGRYFPGTVVWASPKEPTNAGYKNYVPLEQNKSVTLKPGEINQIIFYYMPPRSYSYKVEYREWENQNVVVLDFEEKTEQTSLQVCPAEKQTAALTEMGYYITNENGGRAVTGEAVSRFITPGTKDETVVFYVRSETYTITYQNLEIMGSKAAAELNNPATYMSAKGAGRLNNPTGTYKDEKGKEFYFAGWKMVSTREVAGIRDFENGREVAESVTIEAGSRGNLIFSAVWAEKSGGNSKKDDDSGKKPDKDPKKPKKNKTAVNAGNPSGSNPAMTSPSPSFSNALGLPQTGAAWWFVWLLAIMGILMLAAGFLMKKRGEE